MNYAEISDFEINKAVAFHIGLSTVIAAENLEFNPCNSWADAGPIMAANGISLVFEKGEKTAALAGVSTGPCMELYYDNFVEDENPLRAAMIVFLMME